MPKNNDKIINAVSNGGDVGRVVGQSLRTLRTLAGLTQHDVAERLNVGQAAISKIEHRGDVQISTLQKYVEALGATLRIEAAFDAGARHALCREAPFEADVRDEDQLVFPILGDDVFRSARDVVLSIRPVYSDRIFDGTKTIELRRRFPASAPRGTTAYIYSTSPVRAMVGSAEIDRVTKLPIADLWAKHGKMAQINKADFHNYFDGLTEGFALKLVNARAFSRSLTLSELRDRFGFEPPQSYLYANPVLRTALQDEYSSVPN